MKKIALASFFALLFLTLLWESWLAPKAHWLFWLTLKTLPLLALLPGILRNRLNSFVITTMVLLPYLTEGLVLLWADPARRPFALLEILLTLTCIASASLHVRAVRRQQVRH